MKKNVPGKRLKRYHRDYGEEGESLRAFARRSSGDVDTLHVEIREAALRWMDGKGM